MKKNKKSKQADKNFEEKLYEHCMNLHRFFYIYIKFKMERRISGF